MTVNDIIYYSRFSDKSSWEIIWIKRDTMGIDKQELIVQHMRYARAFCFSYLSIRDSLSSVLRLIRYYAPYENDELSSLKTCFKRFVEQIEEIKNSPFLLGEFRIVHPLRSGNNIGDGNNGL